MNDKAADFNYECEEHCDTCGNTQTGTMHHCNDSMGMATPVFWQCTRCAHPPMLVHAWREAKRLTLRGKLKFNFYMLPKEERQRRITRKEEFRARIAAMRAARGDT